jgi:hypothetical protein
MSPTPFALLGSFVPQLSPLLMEMMSGVLRAFRQRKQRGRVVRIVTALFCSKLYIALLVRFIY